jgi:hypothetical protein
MPDNSKLLMVEGKNDEHVVYALCVLHDVPSKAFEVKSYQGIEALLRTLEVRLLESDRKCLGIVVDVDPDIGIIRRWAAIRSRLLQVGYVGVPELPDPLGTVVPPPDVFRPVVGVWLMPDNRLPGMLEHFIEFLVPPEDPLMPRARSAVADLPAEERKFIPAHQVKAEIHTWLAWQEQPGMPFGSAITARVLDGDSAAARAFVAWLLRLFVDEHLSIA